MVEFLEVYLVDFLVEFVDKIWIFEMFEVIEDLFAVRESEFLVDPREEEGRAVIIAAKHLVF